MAGGTLGGRTEKKRRAPSPLKAASCGGAGGGTKKKNTTKKKRGQDAKSYAPRIDETSGTSGRGGGGGDDDDAAINVGDVGYTFRKMFSDGVWYRGRVIKIRPGAKGGRDRRCLYEDGDDEDLSLAELRTLALLDPEVTKKKCTNPTSSDSGLDANGMERNCKQKAKGKVKTKKECAASSSSDDGFDTDAKASNNKQRLEKFDPAFKLGIVRELKEYQKGTGQGRRGDAEFAKEVEVVAKRIGAHKRTVYRWMQIESYLIERVSGVRGVRPDEQEDDAACINLTDVPSDDGDEGARGGNDYRDDVGGRRRSGRATRKPRKIDDLYGYEHAQSHARKWEKRKKVDGGAEARPPPPSPDKKALLDSTLQDIIPLDKAAESTLNSNVADASRKAVARPGKADAQDSGDGDGTDDEERKWLARVAASLGADARVQKKGSAAYSRRANAAAAASASSSVDGPPVSTIALPIAGDAADEVIASCKPELSSDGNNSNTESNYDMCDAGDAAGQSKGVTEPQVQDDQPPFPLSDCAPGSRHGRLVFRKKDKSRLVAEVLFEKGSSWVEVSVGGELKTYHASHLMVVPSDRFKVGDKVRGNFGKAKRVSPSKRSPAKSTNSSVTSSVEKKGPDLSLSTGLLFCWFCEWCDADNKVPSSVCHACNMVRSSKSIKSMLLEIAEKAIKKDTTTVEDAKRNLPQQCRSSIPDSLLEYLIGTKLEAVKSGDHDAHFLPGFAASSVENLFSWCCCFCTMQNSYKRGKCSACLQAKGKLAERSPLLKVAEDAAIDSKTTEEALSRVHSRERPLIPKGVMDCLVTCVFIIEGKKGKARRCLRQKRPGYDYCEAHIDPILLSSPRTAAQGSASVDTPSYGNGSVSSNDRPRISAINGSMTAFLRGLHQNQVNRLGWTINSIEEAILCGENSAFPLGMKLRKFFPGWGFHDGRIVKVARKLWSDDSTNRERPVLVYRLKYNDGDQEDFLHHELSSLREIYDNCNVTPEDSPERQIPPGAQFETRFGRITIVGHKTPPEIMNKEEGGIVLVQFQDSSSSKNVELDLVKLQLAVLRNVGEFTKAPSVSPSLASPKHSKEPVLEWPGRGSCQTENDPIEEDEADNGDERADICMGLSLHKKKRFDKEDVTPLAPSDVVDNPRDFRPDCDVKPWDPAGCFDYLSWDPYALTICELCGIDKDDNQVVICDECHRGFHTYCLRPVMVNIPKGEWLCSACSGRSTEQITFQEFCDDMSDKHKEILAFLGLKHEHPGQFFRAHSEAIGLFSLGSLGAIKQRAVRQQVRANEIVFDVGGIKFQRSPERHDWRLPTPLLTEDAYSSSLLSMVAAMKYCGMKSSTFDHVYGESTNESMNDPNLETDGITPLSQRNLTIYQAYKHNIRKGVFPPVQIIHDENFGFSAKSLSQMPRHTIIGEYLGEITTMTKSSESNSDSLMVLLDTGDPETSLIIDPTSVGNIARFLSGVNNRSLMSKRKANVRTRRFFVDGKVHIVLFTSRQVEAGEILNYDYNAGNEGKDVSQWAKSGFYDTSNFF